MISSRSGVTLYMILALVLGLVIIGTTFTLNAMRKTLPPPFLLEQKADYQMESAFVFCLSRLNDPQAASNGPLILQEIAPGAWLSVTAKPAGPDSWFLDAQVKAESWTRTLSARAIRTPPASSQPLQAEASVTPPTASDTEAVTAPPSPASHGAVASPWRIFFLTAGEGTAPIALERTAP